MGQFYLVGIGRFGQVRRRDVVHEVEDFPGGLGKNLRAHNLGSADVLRARGRRKMHGRTLRNEPAEVEREEYTGGGDGR